LTLIYLMNFQFHFLEFIIKEKKSIFNYINYKKKIMNNNKLVKKVKYDSLISIKKLNNYQIY